MKTERGLALQDLLTGAYEYVETIEMKSHARVYLLDYLATTEYVCCLSIIALRVNKSADIVCLPEQARRFN